jgi:RimJ/RimL family protein N-acetyltransferase
MQLVPIAKTLEENASLSDLPHLLQSVEYFSRIGYDPPWIGYYAMEDGKFVGSGAFKGKPVNDTVEIAYGTFDNLMNKGIGTAICRELVQLSLKTDPRIKITAGTLKIITHPAVCC